MVFYDYNVAYENRNISEYLYSRAVALDTDGVAGLSKLEYEKFQKFFSQQDIKTYGLDIITLTDEERGACKERLKQKRQSDIISDNIRNSENISEQEKKNLKYIWNTTVAGVGIAGVGGLTAIALEAAGIAGGMLAMGAGGLGLIVAGIGLLGYHMYKNHLENKAEKQ